MNLGYHFNLVYRDFEAAVVGFEWSSRQVKIALKTGLSCVLAVALCDMLAIPHAYWAGISTLVMMRPHVSASVEKGWMRFGGAAIGCFLSLFFAAFTVQNPLLFSALTLVLITMGFYYGRISRHGYFWSYMICHIVMIAMIIVMDPYGTYPEHIAFYRAAAIFVGVVSALIVNVVIWPDFLLDTIQKNDRELREVVASYLEDAFQKVSGLPQGDVPTARERYQYCLELIDKNLKMISESRIEQYLFHQSPVLSTVDLDALRDGLEEFQSWLDIQAGNPAFQESAEVRQEFRQVNGLVVSFIRESGDRAPGMSSTKQELDALFQEMALMSRLQPETLAGKGQLLVHLYEWHHAVYSLFSVFVGDQLPEGAGIESTDRQAGQESPEDEWFSFLLLHRRCAFHIPTLKYAFKGALGLLGVFWFWLYFQVPGGGLNMSVAVITVMQMDLMTTYHKGILRISGCLLGAALGLFWLLIGVESTFFMFLIIFLVVSPLAYIWGSRPGVAYIGLQAGIAFLVSVVHDYGPVDTVGPPLQRLFGILLGVVCVWIINLLVWPEDLLNEFKQQVKRCEKLIHDFVEEAGLALQQQICQFSSAPEVDWATMKQTLDMLRDQQEMSTESARNYHDFLYEYEWLLHDCRLIKRHWNGDLSLKLKKHAESVVQLTLGVLAKWRSTGEERDGEEVVMRQLQTFEEAVPALLVSDYFERRDLDEKRELVFFITLLRRFLHRIVRVSQLHLQMDVR